MIFHIFAAEITTAAAWGSIVAGTAAAIKGIGWLRSRLVERRFPNLKIEISRQGQRDEGDSLWLWFTVQITGLSRLQNASISLSYRAKLKEPLRGTDIGETIFDRPKSSVPDEVPAESLCRPLNLLPHSSYRGEFLVQLREIYAGLRDLHSTPMILVEDHASRRAVAIQAVPGIHTRSNWIELTPDAKGFWTVFNADGSTPVRRHRWYNRHH